MGRFPETHTRLIVTHVLTLFSFVLARFSQKGRHVGRFPGALHRAAIKKEKWAAVHPMTGALWTAPKMDTTLQGGNGLFAISTRTPRFTTLGEKRQFDSRYG